MNTPIINPWMFYFMGISDSLKEFSLAASFFLGIPSAILLFLSIGEYDSDNTRRYCIRCIYIALCLVALNIVLPSQRTLIYMTVAQNITYENLDKTSNTVDKLTEYIIQTVGKMENNKKG